MERDPAVGSAGSHRLNLEIFGGVAGITIGESNCPTIDLRQRDRQGITTFTLKPHPSKYILGILEKNSE